MSDTMNVPLLLNTMAVIEADPSEWHQDTWRCGSGMCFAGWAVTLSGHEWATPADAPGAEMLNASERTAPGRAFYDYSTGNYDTRRQVVRASDQAQADLGLTPSEADTLFAGSNSLEDLRHYVDQLVAGEDLTERYDDDESYDYEDDEEDY